MKWFKHQSDMIEDPRIKRLIKRFQADGYAVYNLVLERITKRIETDSPFPDLEETAEDIADLLKIDTVKVEEIMRHSIHDGLFEQSEVTGRVVCSKVYKFLQQSTTRSKDLRKLIENYENSTVSQIVSDCHRQNETVSDIMRQNDFVTDKSDRTEQNRTEQNRTEEVAASPEPDGSLPATVDDNPEPVRTPPTGRTLSALKEPVANQWQERLTAVSPASTWANVARERAACGRLGKSVARLLSDGAPYESPEEAVDALIKHYLTLRKIKRGWWQDAPVTPTEVEKRWSELITSMAEQYSQEEPVF